MERLQRYRDLEDEDVRFVMKENYGPLLRIGNLFPFIEEGRIWFSIIYTLIAITSVAGYLFLFCITCFLLRNDFVLVGIQFHYLMLALFGAVFMNHFYRNRELMCHIHKMMFEFYDYGKADIPKEVKEDLKQIAAKQRLRLIPFVLLIGVIGLFVAFLGPLIDSIVGASHKNALYNGVYMKTPIPMYFPFTIESDDLHYSVVVFQIFTVVVLALAIGSVILVYIVCCQFLAYELRILITSLENLFQRGEEIYKMQVPNGKLRRANLYSDDQFQTCLRMCLRQNIQHHQKIRKYYILVNRLVKFPILIAFIMATFVIALSMMILVEKTDRIGLLMTNTFAMIGEVANVYIACYFGEEILTLCEKLNQTVYKIEWYFMSQKNKKIVISMQDSTQHPLVIKAALIFTCSMETFSSICNSAYSYFNMLSASSKASNKKSSN